MSAVFEAVWRIYSDNHLNFLRIMLSYMTVKVSLADYLPDASAPDFFGVVRAEFFIGR